MSNEVLSEVQRMLSEDRPKIPKTVTNRLLLAAIIQIGKQVKTHDKAIIELRLSDKRWGIGLSVLVSLATIAILALRGGG